MKQKRIKQLRKATRCVDCGKPASIRWYYREPVCWSCFYGRKAEQGKEAYANSASDDV